MGESKSENVQKSIYLYEIVNLSADVFNIEYYYL